MSGLSDLFIDWSCATAQTNACTSPDQTITLADIRRAVDELERLKQAPTVSLQGLPIHVSDCAVRTAWRVVKHPTRKRRRNWAPVAVEEPAAYQINAFGTTSWVMHPDILNKLKEIK